MSRRNYSEWERVVEYRINNIIQDLRSRQEEFRAPVDLEGLRESFRVLAIEERPMIPEAAIEAVPGGFKVYLQANFVTVAGATVRRRFSLAHEFCHTLFFDVNKAKPEKIRGVPNGDNAERLCNKGAALLVVPTQLLEFELRRVEGGINSRTVTSLSQKFAVSAEVMIRRLQDVVSASLVDRAVILVECQPGGKPPEIRAGLYGPWIRSHFDVPKLGLPFQKWLKISRSDQDVLTHGFERNVPDGKLTVASAVQISASRFLIDISLQPC